MMNFLAMLVFNIRRLPGRAATGLRRLWADLHSNEKLYHCGTLTYTKMALIGVFGWMLWGDFVYTLMETVWPRILPLFLLKKVGATPEATLWIKTTLPQIIGFVACPIISFKSDRYRSKWGRRIPFIILTAPFLSLFLGALGFSGSILGWINLSALPAKLHLSPVMAGVIVIGVIGAGFNFFNEFVGSVYWYLFNDVVPKEYMGRFLGMFRFVGAGAGMLFEFFVFPHALSHTKWIFLGAAFLYLVGFGLMCWRVKEGEYPPVKDVGERTPIFRQVAVYFKDCFTHPIYVLLFLSSAFTTIAGLTAGVVESVFLLSLGISLALQGTVAGVAKFIDMLLQPPGGWVVDKFHPLRVSLAVSALAIVMTALEYPFLWGATSFVIFTAGTLVLNNLNNAAGIPILMRTFPQKKYGQFCSANASVRSLAAVLGALVAGPFLNWISNSGTKESAYRFIYLWKSGFSLLSLVCLAGVYVYWKRLGGDKGYVPPLKEIVAPELAGLVSPGDEVAALEPAKESPGLPIGAAGMDEPPPGPGQK